MRRYYRLLDAMDTNDRWHLGEIFRPDGTELWLTCGVRLEPEGRLHTPIVHPGPVPDFCETVFATPIVIAALAQAIRAVAGTDVQCLPIDIAGHSGMMALNAVRVVRCVDEARSDFSLIPEDHHRADLIGEYYYFSKLVVDPRLIPDDAHFFRVHAWTVGLIVSDAVKAAMERVGCVGAKFVDVNPEPETPATGTGS